MKTQTMIILAAMGVAAYLLLKPGKGAGQSINYDGVAEILNFSAPNTDAYGWRYFNNGVAISPAGVYYKNGTEVWRP